MRKKIIIWGLLMCLLVGCNNQNQTEEATPEATVDKFLEYLQYGDYELIVEEIIDIPKGITKKQMTTGIKTAFGGFNSFTNLNMDCREINNNGTNAKLYCDLSYISSFGLNKTESIKFDLVKRDNWRIELK